MYVLSISIFGVALAKGNLFSASDWSILSLVGSEACEKVSDCQPKLVDVGLAMQLADGQCMRCLQHPGCLTKALPTFLNCLAVRLDVVQSLVAV